MPADHFIARRLREGTQTHVFTRAIIRIAVVSVALSLSVMIVTMALISGFKKEISQKIFDFWGHIHITDVFITQTLEPAPIEVDPDLLDTLRQVAQVSYQTPVQLRDHVSYEEVESNQGIATVNRFVQFAGILSANREIEGLLFKGIDAAFGEERFSDYMEEGQWFSWSSGGTQRGLMISRTTADRMQLAVGDQVVVYFIHEGRQIPRKLKVDGIYKTGLAEYDRKLALVDISLLQEVQNWTSDEISGVEILVEDLHDLDIINGYIYHDVLPPELYTQTIREKSSAIFDWLDLQDINEKVILTLMLIVCIVNMITALMILILERTSMVGILKAMGATSWTIRKIFIRQAGYILIRGMLLGNVIGLVLCFLQKRFEFIRLNEADYYLSVAPIHVEVLSMITINVVTLVVTILFLVVPSYLIQRIVPSHAIRFS